MRKESGYELKIHLRLNDNNDPACHAKPTFNPKYVSRDIAKINCSRCRKIALAMIRMKTGLASAH